MLIIPAIDLLEGCVVRLLRGDYNNKILYSKDPVDIAKKWYQEGATRIHIVDLDGAKSGVSENLNFVKDIISNVPVDVEFGGGVRSEKNIEQLLRIGVEKIILGTKASTDKVFLKNIIDKYKANIIIGVDAKDGYVAIDGWTKSTNIKADDFIEELVAIGVQTIIYTDIATDGALKGHSIQQTRNILIKNPDLKLIASGGVSSLEDIRQLKALDIENLEGVIVGKALYERRFNLREAIEC